MTQRVSDEHVQKILLDARAEIATLRAFVGNNIYRSDYQTVDHMRAEIMRLNGIVAAFARWRDMTKKFHQEQTDPRGDAEWELEQEAWAALAAAGER